MSIRLLGTQDTQKLEEYLSPHKPHCMFICSNMRAAGLDYKGEPFQGEYWGHFTHSHAQLNGVIAHYWNGNMMMFAGEEEILSALTAQFKKEVKRPIAGVLGPNDQAEFVIRKLELSGKDYNINRSEELYSIDLIDLTTPKVSPNFSIVHAQEVEKGLLVEWVQAYDIEALGAAKDSALRQKAETTVDRLKKGDCWLLLKNNVLVALSAFNARLEEMVQVGPVWTPPENRNQGFARLLLAYTLAEEKRKGIQKAILFTNNPPAIRAYQAIGFKKIGNYRLALLKEPITLKN